MYRFTCHKTNITIFLYHVWKAMKKLFRHKPILLLKCRTSISSKLNWIIKVEHLRQSIETKTALKICRLRVLLWRPLIYIALQIANNLDLVFLPFYIITKLCLTLTSICVRVEVDGAPTHRQLIRELEKRTQPRWIAIDNVSCSFFK